MKIQIEFHTTSYRGDHSADVCLAVEYKEGETIAELLRRINLEDSFDWVTLRKIAIEA